MTEQADQHRGFPDRPVILGGRETRLTFLIQVRKMRAIRSGQE